MLVVFDEDIGDGFGPVGAVAQEAEVGERFLGGSQFPLAFGEFVAEGDEEFAVALALVLRQREDASDVVALGGFLLLAEVADEMAAVFVARGHAVEEEGVDVVVERFVVEEEFAEEAEVAAPAPLAAAVDFEKGHEVVPVDFVAGGVEEQAFGPVPGEGVVGGVVAQAEFANVDGVGFGEGRWVGGEVPGFHFEGAHLDVAEISDARDLGLILGHATSRAEFFDFLFTRIGLVLTRVRRFCSGGSILNIDEVDLRFFLTFGGAGGDLRGDD